MVDIYPPLFTDPEGDSCFSIYQIRWITKRFFNFFFWNFRETTRHFSLRSQNSEYPMIFRVTGADQNARKLLSTDFVNTNNCYADRSPLRGIREVARDTRQPHSLFTSHEFENLLAKVEAFTNTCTPTCWMEGQPIICWSSSEYVSVTKSFICL